MSWYSLRLVVNTSSLLWGRAKAQLPLKEELIENCTHLPPSFKGFCSFLKQTYIFSCTSMGKRWAFAKSLLCFCFISFYTFLSSGATLCLEPLSPRNAVMCITLQGCISAFASAFRSNECRQCLSSHLHQSKFDLKYSGWFVVQPENSIEGKNLPFIENFTSSQHKVWFQARFQDKGYFNHVIVEEMWGKIACF